MGFGSVTKEDLKRKESYVNQLLTKIKLKVAYRYDYVAIDIINPKTNLPTHALIVGLTKRRAWFILDAIEQVLRRELE